MLRISLLFLLIALVAGMFGFSGVYLAGTEIAKALCFVFAVLFALGMMSHGARRYAN
jgi:uncharacterized membrane protein YtjA (UPF0391 family)